MSDRSLTDEFLDAMVDGGGAPDELSALRTALADAQAERDAARQAREQAEAQREAALRERDLVSARLDEVEGERAKLAEQNGAMVALLATVQHQLAVLRRNSYGRKSERVPPGQLPLLPLIDPAVDADDDAAAGEDEALEPASPSDADATPPEEGLNRAGNRRGKANRRHGRRKLPEHLTTVEVPLPDPPEVLADPARYRCIGVETSEHLEYAPGRLIRVRTTRSKFARSDQGMSDSEPQVVAAPIPSKPIQRGMLGASLGAELILAKYGEHMPLYRLEKRFARLGLPITRSTLCGWTTALGELVHVVVDAMLEDARQAEWVMTDATGTLVLNLGECRRTHFWVLVAPGRSVLFRHSAKHDQAAVTKLLGDGFKGIVVADANAVFNHVFGDGKATESGCWAHARRYVFDSIKSDRERAGELLARISQLFEIERGLEEAPRKERERVRQRRSAPIVDWLMARCQTFRQQLDEHSPLAQAAGYFVNQEGALRHFLSDGRVPIHNNDSERQLRHLVVGRKNWLFHGSDEGAEHTAAFVSLLASCQMHRIEPWIYLRDLFTLLPDWPRSRVFELAPMNWRTTIARPDVAAALEMHPFRMVSDVLCR